MLRQYKIGFDPAGLILFLAIMLPNAIWFALPAPNDILRHESITPVFDAIASVCQILIVVSLCMLLNKERKRIRLSPLIITTTVFCLLYFLSWMLYYLGEVNAVIIVGLTLFPCLAFFFFALDRKNMIAVVPIALFTVCHLVYGVVNFII